MKKLRLILVLLMQATLLCLAGTSCNHGRPCLKLHGELSAEPYGATAINAATGNQGLSVGINRKGTVTLFKWPSPSFYDHVKFMTASRKDERMGALENEGVLSGVRYRGGDREGFFWLRDAYKTQRYRGPRSVVVITEFKNSEAGILVEQSDFVDPDNDVLWRHYLVKKLPGSDVERAALVSYLNFAPQVSKIPFLPLRDWCLDEIGNSKLEWQGDHDLFIHSKTGKDKSIDKKVSVNIAFGFAKESSAHQAGYDRKCSLLRAPAKKDPFYMAAEGLQESDQAFGQVAAAVEKELDLSGGEAQASLLVSAAPAKKEAVELIEEARQKDYSRSLDRVEKAWQERLANIPLPRSDDPRIKKVAIRSVISMLLGSDRDSGAVVASMSTQPPYGLDWPRDGAFINMALMEAGFPDLVRKRNLFLASVQSRPGHKVRHVPKGNWASNYTADGVPGFPLIWWEIDETGWGIYQLVRYYEQTGDVDYLEEVYPAVERAADFLVEFKDPKTGMQKKAHEDDNPKKTQTPHGAVPVYIGLRAAARAAHALDRPEHKKKWLARSEEIKKAMLDLFYDPACKRFVRDPDKRGGCDDRVRLSKAAGLILWPAGMLDDNDPRAEHAADQLWEALSRSFDGEREMGYYEVYGLLCLAHYWKDRPEKLERLKRGLEWSSRVPTTDTGHFGEVWITIDGKVEAGEGQPHIWHHALFYLASLETYGKEL
ncbi:MAG: hypothetical protein R6V10_00080 [bacterium]